MADDHEVCPAPLMVAAGMAAESAEQVDGDPALRLLEERGGDRAIAVERDVAARRAGDAVATGPPAKQHELPAARPHLRDGSGRKRLTAHRRRTAAGETIDGVAGYRPHDDPLRPGRRVDDDGQGEARRRLEIRGHRLVCALGDRAQRAARADAVATAPTCE